MALSKAQMLTALDTLIADGGVIRRKFLQDFVAWTPEVSVWINACSSTIEAIYGSASTALATFKGVYFIPPPTETYANDAERTAAQLAWYDSGLSYAISILIGYRYSIDRLLPDAPARPTRNVFVSHGGRERAHVNKIKDLLSALGLVAVIVEDLPNFNMSVNHKVLRYMSLCTAAVMLATEDDEALALEKKRPRPNVENEVGMVQAAQNIGGRIVYLKEPDVKFASNYREKAWITFNKERIEEAFIPIIRELLAFGLIG